MKMNYFCFTRKGQYYAIDTVRLIPVELTPNSYSLLERLQNSKKNIKLSDIAEQEGYSDIRRLAEQDILFHSTCYNVQNSFRELNISLIPTLACNLNCKYCYSNRKQENMSMPIEKVYDIMDFFCSHYSFDFCRVDFVSGGEPLYDRKALIAMIEALCQSLDKYDKKHLFWLCTNGLLLNDTILQYLDGKNFNLGISIDGPEIVNDMNRIDLKGKGTYKRVVDNIRKIEESNNLSRNIKNLWNCAVITSSTKSLVDVMHHSYQLGFRNLQMKVAWSNDKHMRLSEKKLLKLYSELTEYLFRLVEQGKIDEFLIICNENDTYGKVLLRLIIQSGVTRRCNAGVNKFSISPEGKIYPCDSFLGIEEYCIGDIYNGFNELYYQFSEIRNDSIEKCKKCWARYICGGDCFYNALLNTGCHCIPDDKVCYFMLEIVKMCIELVITLYRSFPQDMKKIYTVLSKKAIRMEPKR